MAMTMPIIETLLLCRKMGHAEPRFGWPWVPRASSGLIELIVRLRQQGVALGDRRRHVDHRPIGAAGVLAHALEGRAVVEVVALHEDPLGALDDGPALERVLEALDLLGQLALLAPASRGDLDGALDRVGRLLTGVGEDAALGGLRHEVRVLAVEQRDHRPGGEGVDLFDEVECGLVFAVDVAEREVGIVAGDGLGGLAQADRDLRRRLTELARLPRSDLQRSGVLIGQEDPQRSLSVLVAHPTFPHLVASQPTPADYNAVAGHGPPPAATRHRAPPPRRSYQVRALCHSTRHPSRSSRARDGRPGDRDRRGGARGRAGRQPGRAGPRALRALPGQARPGRPRDARRALPAARAPARAPLPAPRGALR